MTTYRRFLGAAAALSMLATPALGGGWGAKVSRPIVVELYTSQGCSSCPPADSLLAQLAQRSDVIALTLPVTYWDMLGWKDTLASEANTHRQETYSNMMGRGGVYTPQMVIDGVDDVVGSRVAQVNASIASREADMKPPVPVEVSVTPEYIHVIVGASSKAETGTVWLFHILTQSSVNVGAGENQGRKLTYRNIVRDVRPIATWKGDSLSIAMPRHDIPVAYDSIAVVLQQGNGYGRVIGAGMLGRSAASP